MYIYLLCRPGQMLGAVSCGRGVLSMSALSYGVIRVDQENSLTSLTLQDCGQIMPGGEYTGFSKCPICTGVFVNQNFFRLLLKV